MRSFSYSTHVERTPAELFAFMTDLRQVTWRSLVRRIDVVGGGPLREGARIVSTIDVMGKVKQMESEVWAYEPPRRIGFRNTASNVTGQFEYSLMPEGGGTRITFTCDIRPHGFMWLMLPLLLHSNRVRYRDQLDRLKAAAEKQPTG
jgi:hypothetical protein